MRDEKLAEPGAGWRNDLIELAHVKTDQAPLYSYLEDATEVTRDWLKALHAPKVPAQCYTCSTVTTRQVVTAVQGTEIREHAILWTKYQCEACATEHEIRKLQAALNRPADACDPITGQSLALTPEVRERYEAYIREHTQRSAA